MQWHLKSLASWLFTHLFVQVHIKENIKSPGHWPLWGESTGDQWISPHKGPVTWKMFPFDDTIMNTVCSCKHILSNEVSNLGNISLTLSTLYDTERWPNVYQKIYLHVFPFTADRRRPLCDQSELLTNKAWQSIRHCPGVGVTKHISPIPLFSQFFRIIRILVSFLISHSNLTGVTTAELWWYLSNMNGNWRI